MAKRRSGAEVEKLIKEIDALVVGGMSKEAACEKVGLAPSVYQKHKRKERGGPVVRGSVRADSLPPRPQRGGKRVKKIVDLNDIRSVALRIAAIDVRLGKMWQLKHERKSLANRLHALLNKGDKA